MLSTPLHVYEHDSLSAGDVRDLIDSVLLTRGVSQLVSIVVSVVSML